jgi:hypothetical protein
MALVMKGIIRLPSLLLIPDANVIISSYELGVWSHVTRHHKIYVPSIILHSEVYYYEKPDGTIVPIDLKKQVGTSITAYSDPNWPPIMTQIGRLL